MTKIQKTIKEARKIFNRPFFDGTGMYVYTIQDKNDKTICQKIEHEGRQYDCIPNSFLMSLEH